ncbi:MAG: diaminopimelate epimerase [Flavobacteriaceae bacterium]|nr:diaminopimelate epimerase [Flavobacteriaceae bacterium]
MKIQFDKYQGAGNDFIIVDNRSGIYDLITTSQFHSMCNRFKGVGADGVILIESHPVLDFEMRYFNSDGNLSTMCGNGGRCAVAFAQRHNMISKKTQFLAVDGPHEAELISETEVRLQMQDVDTLTPRDGAIITDTGSPHIVLPLDDIKSINVKEEGAVIRYSKAFKTKGINVNFIQKENANTYSIRTYERGVENETLACGTGAVAGAIAMHSLGISEGGTRLLMKALGGDLTIDFEIAEQGYKNIYLQGSATFVYSGIISI